MKNILKLDPKHTNSGKKSLIESFFSLSMMYGLDLILPLLLIPFLIRYIGIEKVGLLNFATAAMAYFSIIINYGFNLTATKEVALCKDDVDARARLFNVVMTSKVFLSIVCVLFLGVLLWLVPRFRSEYLLYLIVFGGVFFQNMSPVWFFQGVGQLKQIALYNLIVKTVCTAVIFVMVKGPQDYMWVAILQTAGFFLVAVLSLVHLLSKYHIQVSIPLFSEVRTQLHNGMYVFLSQLKISFFSNFNVLILGFFAGNTAVGYFTSADKVIRALAVIQIPVTTTFFPHFARLLKENKKAAYALIRKLSAWAIGLYVPVLLLVFVFAYPLVQLVFGDGMEAVAVIIRILVLLPLLIILNNFAGTQMLLNMGKDKVFFNVLLSTAVLNVILVIPLTLKFSFYGTAVSVLISELYLCIAMFVMYNNARKTY